MYKKGIFEILLTITTNFRTLILINPTAHFNPPKAHFYSPKAHFTIRRNIMNLFIPHLLNLLTFIFDTLYTYLNCKSKKCNCESNNNIFITKFLKFIKFQKFSKFLKFQKFLKFSKFLKF